MRRKILVLSRVGAALGAVCLVAPAAALAGPADALASSPRTGGNYAFNSLACPTISRCWAVGYQGTTVFNNAPLADQWTGSKWSNATIPASPSEPASTLAGVACVSSTFCWAVGSAESPQLQSSPFAELWNGHHWAVASTPTSYPNEVGLAGVTCLARNDCWAVGRYTNGFGAGATYAERWTESDLGSHWAVSTIAIPTGATSSGLASVACGGTRNCTAVGTFKTSKGVAMTLAEHFDGTRWTVTKTPNPSGSTGSYLDGVACNGPSSCTAVGYYGGTGTIAYPSLAEHWNGKTWKLMTTANASHAVGGDILNGIACTSSTSCMGVGYSGSATGIDTIVERLTGTTWRIVRSPNPSGSTRNFLNAVACPSATNCNAVGYGTISNEFTTLGEHWDGSAWKLVSMPN